MVKGMLNRGRIRDIIRNFIYLPDSSKKDEKITSVILITTLHGNCVKTFCFTKPGVMEKAFCIFVQRDRKDLFSPC